MNTAQLCACVCRNLDFINGACLGASHSTTGGVCTLKVMIREHDCVCVKCAYLCVCVYTLVGLPSLWDEIEDANAQIIQSTCSLLGSFPSYPRCPPPCVLWGLGPLSCSSPSPYTGLSVSRKLQGCASSGLGHWLPPPAGCSSPASSRGCFLPVRQVSGQMSPPPGGASRHAV